MKKILLIIAASLMLAAPAMSASTIDKMSVVIYPRTHRGQAEWRWTPKIDMDLFNMPEAKPITVEYTLPTGKPFVTVTCTPDPGWADVNKTMSGCGNDLEAESATTLTGQFGFNIKVEGASLYSGKFTVGKYVFNPAGIPQNAKNFYYYVDYDWRLTTAYVGYWKEEYTPTQLFAWVWIKGGIGNDNIKAYLYYNGKQIGESSYGGDLAAIPEENEPLRSDRLRFRFNATFAKPESEGLGDWWRFDQNPGEYEIRVNRHNAVARSFKFSVASGGKLVVTNVGKEIRDGYNGLIVPVTLSGNSDGKLDPVVMKSGWWGNPISGLTP